MLRHRINRQSRMSISSAGSHFGCYPYGFHNLPFRGTGSQSSGCMGADAVGALRYMCHGYRDDLLGHGVQRASGKHRLTEILKRFGRPRR